MSVMVDRVARAVDAELSRLGVGLKPKTQKAVARAALDAVRDLDGDGGRFTEWPTRDLAAQCKMQALDQLDPEFSQFMLALSERLTAIPPVNKTGTNNRSSDRHSDSADSASAEQGAK